MELVNDIGLTSIESTKSIYPALTKLQFFNEIETVCKLLWKNKTNSNNNNNNNNNMILDITKEKDKDELLQTSSKIEIHIPTEQGLFLINLSKH